MLLGRQGIFDRADQLHGHEFFIRHEGSPAAWPGGRRTGDDEHRATVRVLANILGGQGLSGISGESQAVFVNASYPLLADPALLTERPDRLVLEVPDTIEVDRAVLDGVRSLRALGVRIAIDDFSANADQRALLPLADYVKVDARELAAEGFTLMEVARSRQARLIAKRIEDTSVRRTCEMFGFDLFQGNALEHTVVLDRTQETPIASG